jgi:hypothetical protein
VRLAQYKLYRAPSDAMITSYCSFSSLLLALTYVHHHENFACMFGISVSSVLALTCTAQTGVLPSGHTSRHSGQSADMQCPPSPASA